MPGGMWHCDVCLMNWLQSNVRIAALDLRPDQAEWDEPSAETPWAV